MKTVFVFIFRFALMTFLFSCNNNSPVNDSRVTIKKADTSMTVQPDSSKKTVMVDRKKPGNITYHLDTTKKWLATQGKQIDSIQERIVIAVNRTDKASLRNQKTIIVPSDLSGDLAYYLPFPLSVPAIKDINKILLFSYPTQSFAAYENGELQYTAQTNMGRKKDPTPTGLYYCNWKAEETTSTSNDEWDLKWNFNIENKEGIGFHQYTLPGYPASHSCLRLTETDAKYLYDWADQWVLKGTDNIIAKGTPVIVFGTYDFGGPKPWLKLVNDPHALDIPVEAIEKEIQPFMNEILAEQQKKSKSGK